MPHHIPSSECRLADRRRGFTLVELLVSMALGVLLLGGMISVFSGNRRASDVNDAMTNMQENMRFAMNTLAGDIRMAGHQGCLDLNASTIEIIANSRPTADLRATAVGGAVVNAANAWAPAFALGTGAGRFAPPAINPAIVGTHALAVQFGEAEMSPLRGAMVDGSGSASSSAPLPLDDPDNDNPLDFEVGDTALVSTCEDGEVFTVTGVATGGGTTRLSHGATLNASGSFNEIYGNGATAAQVRVMKFSTNVYYVGDTGATNIDGDAITALYQQSAPFNDVANNPPVELVRGVENLQLSFGVGTNGNRLRYVGSDDPLYNPLEVRSVRIGLLMVSQDAIAADDDTTTYVLAGQAITPADATSGTTYKADKRFRLAFNTTVKVRNRRGSQ